ncbi:NAD(P)-binding protein [Cryphonectria parasitica EP155]|uniref:NAD(P)-binding protein n=1 Tax=Cryphonectria parasitica (strain ATCC 38755 / EP155) TaxID=660469 RepID=A0A9P4XXM3_CRYP1|nr:NAD(P)-binding protein [Cryphonectria parasitica EP155]KAF3763164.1 NAD(P)-binding protein [Cryphonectria parasitica EP155]
MADTKRKVLITGCSDGSLGAGLAVAFHKAGLHVYATARNPAKMTNLAALGIETLQLDPTSASSIATCLGKIPALDILVNNAGGMYKMSIADMNIADAKACFDLNVWSYLAMVQAFLPLLLKSPHGALIANQTSAASVLTIPFQSTYNASKAAIASFSDCLRLELEAFDIKVVELKTSLVKSNFVTDKVPTTGPELPKGSIYEPAREVVESALRGGNFTGQPMEQEIYARETVEILLKDNPPFVVYLGEGSEQVPSLHAKVGSMDEMVKHWTQLNEVEAVIKAYRQSKAEGK